MVNTVVLAPTARPMVSRTVAVSPGFRLDLGESAIPIRGKAFQRGLFFIQDAASMLPPNLLEPKPGERVLDLCGAPGGKTTHIAALTRGEARVICNDSARHKFHRVMENIEGLQTPGVFCLASDALLPPFGQHFDRVLLDAPCSGLGTLRRRPDIKWRIIPERISRLAELQLALLRSAIQVCKNGGRVVYSVCTSLGEMPSGRLPELSSVSMAPSPLRRIRGSSCPARA